MALVILLLMMSSALLLGTYLREELKMTLNATNSIAAFFAADSGLEKSLYYLKYGMQESDLSIFEQLESGSPFNISGSDASYEYEAATVTSPVPTAAELAQGQHTFSAYDIGTSTSAQVSILDPTGEVTGINWGSNPSGLNYSYTVFWKIRGCFPDHASDKLEVSHVSFTDNFGEVQNDSRIIICNCALSSEDWCDSSVSQFVVYDNRYYRFSFRPLDAKVDQIGFDLYEDFDIVGIRSEVFLNVKGFYHNSQAVLQARLSAGESISDVFNYIIFSEEPLVKDL